MKFQIERALGNMESHKMNGTFNFISEVGRRYVLFQTKSFLLTCHVSETVILNHSGELHLCDSTIFLTPPLSES